MASGSETVASRFWFLDTNLVAIWMLARGGLLERIATEETLPVNQVEAYVRRYDGPLRFFDALAAAGGPDRMFVSSLVLTEAFQVVRHEIHAVRLFNRGVPLSLWRRRQNNPDSHDIVDAVGDATMDAWGRLIENCGIRLIEERGPTTDDDYWSYFLPVLYGLRDGGVMDAILTTTAIMNRANYFVTMDRRLRTTYNRLLRSEEGMAIVSPEQAVRILGQGT